MSEPIDCPRCQGAGHLWTHSDHEPLWGELDVVAMQQQLSRISRHLDEMHRRLWSMKYLHAIGEPQAICLRSGAERAHARDLIARLEREIRRSEQEEDAERRETYEVERI